MTALPGEEAHKLVEPVEGEEVGKSLIEDQKPVGLEEGADKIVEGVGRIVAVVEVGRIVGHIGLLVGIGWVVGPLLVVELV